MKMPTSKKISKQTKIVREKSNQALIVTCFENFNAYSGPIKKEIQLESLNKKNSTTDQFILIASDYKVKDVILVENQLPIFISRFEKISKDEVSKLLGQKIDREFQVAKLNIPRLLNESLESIWSGEIAINLEHYGYIHIRTKKKKQSVFQNFGDQEEVKQSIDSVILRGDLEGNGIIQIEGWAFSEKKGSVLVEMYFDEKLMNTTITNKIRPDVLEFYKVQKPITPGFSIETRLTDYTPNHIGIFFKTETSGVVLRFDFSNIPNSKDYIKKEETIFKDYELDSRIPPSYKFKKYEESLSNDPISIIIPTNLSTKNIYDLIPALKINNQNSEVIVIAHGVDAPNRAKLSEISDKVIFVEGKFNWSLFNNKGASVAKFENIIFLNDDVFPISQNWKQIVQSYFNSTEVGILGARLIGKDLRVQHDGISVHGLYTNHINVGKTTLHTENDLESISVDAVTGAFLATTKSIFNKLSGFDGNLPVVGNDLDFCLRVGRLDKKILIPSDLIFFHAEGSSRANLVENNFKKILDFRLPESGRLRALDLNRALDNGDEPISIIDKSYPAAIKTIAVVKVDHIGDFYSALSSIRRLSENFSKAKISLICSPEIASVAKAINFIDEVLPVRVFSKISGDGHKKSELPLSLLQKKFDLVVDLRKHEDARDIFNAIQGTYKYSFNSRGAINSLSEVYFIGHDEKKGLEYMPSVTDELHSFINLVAESLNFVPVKRKINEYKSNNHKFNVKKKISIFPLSGNKARVYPLTLFMEYAIFEKNRHPNADITFYLPNDQIGEYVNLDSANMLKKNAVKLSGLQNITSMIDIIKKSDLVVTNNTGPMWIASEYDTPCIAIFSGVVSRTHWLPKKVIQISRSVSCGPCYISSPEQCHRDMYCINSIDPSYINVISEKVLANNRIESK
jgi:ADP-heptose:LPS heptosyltransferase/GT2 family glycosyltransferase